MNETIDFDLPVHLHKSKLFDRSVKVDRKTKSFTSYCILSHSQKNVHYLVSNRYNLSTEGPMLYQLLFAADVDKDKRDVWKWN
jgi:hypothetical protein